MAEPADHKAREQLLGTWTLVSAIREEIPSGATKPQFGEAPRGYLTYSPDGRTMITLLDDGRARIWDAVTGHERVTLGRIRVLKTESKGKGNKRIRIEIVDA